MFNIIEAKLLGPGVKQFEIEAPRIARKQLPGQFVIIRVNDHGERIPLTIKGSNRERGTITLVVQAVGKTTFLLNELNAGDSILDVVGPLGKASEIERFGNVVVIGGGVGTAIALPTAAALKEAGNHVTAILGARTKDLLILETEVRAASDELFIMTDDGSYGEKGLVTDKLRALMANQTIDYVLAIGPIPMMRAVAEATRERAIRTVVSLNTIMVDGTGMCGGCRVVVNGKSEFACVDGPEFDAHQVDFQVLVQRNAMYREQEKIALDSWKGAARCPLPAARRTPDGGDPSSGGQQAGGSDSSERAPSSQLPLANRGGACSRSPGSGQRAAGSDSSERISGSELPPSGGACSRSSGSGQRAAGSVERAAGSEENHA